MKIKTNKNKINWKCKGSKCNNNCCGTFDGRNSNFDKSYCSVSNINHNEILLLGKDVKNILKCNKRSNIKKNKGNYYIRLKKDGSCPFLNKGKCSIYSIRPLLCRSYPFYIDASSGLVVDKSCPGLESGWTDKNIIDKYVDSATNLYLEQIKNIKKQKNK